MRTTCRYCGSTEIEHGWTVWVCRDCGEGDMYLRDANEALGRLVTPLFLWIDRAVIERLPMSLRTRIRSE